MSEHETIILQTLVELRGQIIEDFRGDYSDMKLLIDKAITNLINKQLLEDKKSK